MVIGEQSLEIMWRDLTDEVVMVHISQLFLNQLLFVSLILLKLCVYVCVCG